MGPGSIAASVRSIRSALTGSTSRSQQSEGAGSDSDSIASSDSGESEIESLFVYTRVPRLPATFFRKDHVSACLIRPYIHVYATHRGIVHLARPDSTPIRTVRVHRASVLDIDSDGVYVATASIDGTVVIASIEDPGDTVQASFRRPVHTVSLHPDYRTQRSYVSGGTAGQVVLSERGWLKTRSDTVLAQSQSTILALKWSNSRLIWCNEDGITVYNMDNQSLISRVSRPPNSPRADLYRPRICIVEGEAIVSWASSITVLRLSDAKVLQKFDFSFPVAGAVPFHRNQLVVLAVEALPELKVIDRQIGQESYADELELSGEKIGVNDYHLDSPQESRDKIGSIYVVSSSDAVVAHERTPRDHVVWLSEHGKHVEAYSAAQQVAKQFPGELSEDNVRDVALRAAKVLAEEEKWEQVTQILSQILRQDDKAQWLLWANQYFNAGQELLLGDILPHIDLEDVHDAVLETATTKKDAARLSKWTSHWPKQLWDAHKLSKSLEEATEQNLRAVLGDVYVRSAEYVKAVQVFVSINSSRAFHVANHYHLWSEPEIQAMLGSILTAGDGDGEGGYVGRIRELIDARAEIPPSRVVSQLNENSGQDLLLFGYLTELGLVDDSWLSEFADLMVRLFAKYDRNKLLGFLTRYDSYDLLKAIALCRENEFDNELVYLLGKVGQTQEALDVIVTRLHDYNRAVEFARSQGEETLDQLVDYSQQYPEVVLALLKCVEVSPAKVLSMVPASMRIPGLKQALCGVFNDQETSVALSEGALNIVKLESKHWFDLLGSSRSSGTLISEDEYDWTNPVLFTGSESKEVDRVPDVTTFSAKISHLRRLLGGSK